MRIAILKYEDAVPTCVTGPADIWYGMSRMYPVATGSPMKKSIQIEFGAFSFTSFMIYLIEKLCGHEESIIASKILMINVHDLPQSTFSIFRFQHDHADEAISNAQAYIEKNYKQSLALEGLASRSNMSVRNFIRRFEQATANTPLEYLQRVRIEAAKKMLETKNEGIAQIASRCGYEDIDYFGKIFRRYVAMTPRAYREKYGRNKNL